MNQRPSNAAPNAGRTVPIHNILLIRQELEAQGVEAIELFRDSGVSPKVTENHDSLLTYDQVIKIVENAVRLSNSPGLGLRIGHNESPTDWGVLGFAMLSCGTVAETLSVVSRFHKTAASLTEVTFSEDQDRLVVEFLPIIHLSAEALPFVVEHQFSALHSVLQVLTGQPVPVQELNLSFARPNYAEMYDDIFQATINFDQPRIQYVFHSSYLELPIVHSSKLGATLATNLCKTQLKRQAVESGFVSRVRYYLLIQGNNFSDARTIADCMHITPRTLRNRLQMLGTSFQEILDESRQQLAIRYLESSDLPLDDIALLVGFSDTSNFRRAFKKWTGHVPSHYRQSH